jgi:hypothetical protein
VAGHGHQAAWFPLVTAEVPFNLPWSRIAAILPEGGLVDAGLACRTGMMAEAGFPQGSLSPSVQSKWLTVRHPDRPDGPPGSVVPARLFSVVPF